MIKLELTETELQTLMGLLDAGVRSTGIGSVMTAAALLEKISMAVEVSKVAAPKDAFATECPCS